MKVVVSYGEPDMDGTSCMYAYSELLNRLGEKTNYYIWNEPKQEVKIVCDMFGITLGGLKKEELKQDYDYITVDVNGIDQIPDIVSPDRIIQVIDHHGPSRSLPTYVNANIQIERLGAAATLVAERYKNAGFVPSRESSILLYYGIISNSINLKAPITKQKDRDMANWLKANCIDISEEKIKEIFKKKSQIKDENLRLEMECEIPNNPAPGIQTIVAQLEVVDIDGFLKDKKDKILTIMKEVKAEKGVEYIFINCVDILNGKIVLFAADDISQKYCEKVFGFKFSDGEYRQDSVIQRKDLTKIIRGYNYENFSLE